MFLEERHKLILAYLNEYEKGSVIYFSERFNVSQETIRKDLSKLAKQKKLTRCYGGAMVLRRKFTTGVTSNKDRNIESLLSKYRKQNIKSREKKMNGKICIFGSFNVDIVAQVARFLKGGESIMATKSMMGPGGKGANQALVASHAEAKVHFVAKVGKDQFSQFAYDHLSSSKIDSFTLYQSEVEPTGNAVIYVSEKNGENMVAIYSGANFSVTDDEVAALEDNLKNADVFLVQLENNFSATLYALKLANALGVKAVLNPAPFSLDILPYLNYIDLITPNETETSLLSGIEIIDLDSARLAANKIHQLGAKMVIITLGSKGALIFDGSEYKHISAFMAVPVDTTGAGDAFNGALCASLAKGENIYHAATYASAFASLAVEREGASNMPSHEQVLARLANQKLQLKVLFKES